MTFKKVCPIHDGHPGYYAYEYEPYYDPKIKRARQRMVRYLGPCDKDGKLRRFPRSRFEGTTTFLSGGRLLAFHPAVVELHLRHPARRALQIDEEVAATSWPRCPTRSAMAWWTITGRTRVRAAVGPPGQATPKFPTPHVAPFILRRSPDTWAAHRCHLLRCSRRRSVRGLVPVHFR